MIKFLKKGNEIHIKKNKQGSFTRWCGGEVTEECIKKGKNSPNSAIRKKATFADNVRKWHGGGNIKIIIAQDGTNTQNFFQKAGTWINNNPELVNTALNGISSIMSANKQSKDANQYAESKKKEMKAFTNKTWADKYKEALKNQNDRSSIVNMSRAYNQASGDVAQEVQEKEQQVQKEIAQKQQEASQAQADAWGGIAQGLGQWGINALSKKFGNSASTNTSTGTSLTTNSFWTTPSLNTSMNSYSNPNTFWNM